MVPSTGGKRITDTYRFKHHAIDIPQLTPADRILEAAKRLDEAITQQPKQAPIDEITAIELLREVLPSEKWNKLPQNSVQWRKSAQRAAAEQIDHVTHPHLNKTPSQQHHSGRPTPAPIRRPCRQRHQLMSPTTSRMTTIIKHQTIIVHDEARESSANNELTSNRTYDTSSTLLLTKLRQSQTS
jgi:hypothetical protein